MLTHRHLLLVIALLGLQKAHAAVETVLEKRFLEVGSLLENELRRRLKHTKMSEAVHAAVQAKLEVCHNTHSNGCHHRPLVVTSAAIPPCRFAGHCRSRGHGLPW